MSFLAVSAAAVSPFAAAALSDGLALAMLGTTEILIIAGVVVLLFGANKLPQLGKGLGEAIGNFKKAAKDGEKNALGAATSPDEIDATPRIDSHKKADPHA